MNKRLSNFSQWGIELVLFSLACIALHARNASVPIVVVLMELCWFTCSTGIFYSWWQWARDCIKRPETGWGLKYRGLYGFLALFFFVLSVGGCVGIVGGVCDNVGFRDWFSVVWWVVLVTPIAILSFISVLGCITMLIQSAILE